MKLDSVFAYFNSVSWGRVTVLGPGREVNSFGDGNQGPGVEIAIHNTSFLRRLATNPALALGESYVSGQWDLTRGSLAELFGIITKHLDNRPEPGLLRRAGSRLLRMSFRSNRPPVAKRAVRHHYDRGDEIFRLFLDPSMAYSCGYALSASDSLEEMQQQKYKLICKKLGLQGRASVIDLGCGWGGLLLHIARHFDDVDAVGVTLSRNQFDYFTEQITAQGFDGRVRAELRDFRDASDEQYDFLVSVGMFEHLGCADYSTFMQKASRLLKPGGRGLLQTMGTTDDISEPPDPWISKYIFPRHRLPRLEEILGEMRRSRLHVGHVENLKPHYAETFRRWGENLRANRSILLEIVGDEQFYRMWDYYLNLCEAGFRYGSMELYQILFSNHRWSFPARFEFGLRPPEPYTERVADKLEVSSGYTSKGCTR
jgi:cyclopropane-fatty-acyl-phospholipid synthase